MILYYRFEGKPGTRDTWDHLLMAAVTLMAATSEVLVITLSGIHFSPAIADLAFNLSVFISLGILAAMIATVASVLAWASWTRYERELLNIPENIADVLALLGGRDAQKALRELYDGNTSSASHMRFALRKQAGSRAWCVEIWTSGSPAIEC